MTSFEELPFAEQVAEAAAALRATADGPDGRTTVAVNVTSMPDQDVAVLRDEFTAAGLGVVLFDDSVVPRRGTLPSAALELDDDLMRVVRQFTRPRL